MSAGAPAALGVSFTAHWLPIDAVLRLARRADELGFALVLVDGDSGVAAPDPGRPIYDPTALVAAVALATRSARVGAMHLAHFWNAALLARSLATLQELAAGRLVALFGVGAHRETRRLGLPQPGAGERVARLEETVAAVRALLAGETLTASGRFVALERARITPPARPVPIAISAAGARALEVVARHADVWDANVPPLPERLEPLRARLGRALPTWIWVFARPGAARDDAVSAYRRCAPWFGALRADEAARAVLWGEPARCHETLARMRSELGLALPIADLSGLDEAEAGRALAALAPASLERMS
ncbi:MAG TPA: LLM class flavin-dependent oxidoreductase [Myxococcota bacterium]|nr:LLM class flavin-dependent oxidoreductase [Myxococcota bacterium]